MEQKAFYISDEKEDEETKVGEEKDESVDKGITTTVLETKGGDVINNIASKTIETSIIAGTALAIVGAAGSNNTSTTAADADSK